MRLTNFEGRLLFLLIGLALVRGLIYASVVPPWQAPDEPRHFEYVKLLYEKRRLVGWSDVTPAVEQEIIASMDQFRFWEFGVFTGSAKPGTDAYPSAFSQIWVGTSHELHQPPLSYLLYVIPLAVTAHKDTAVELYALRVSSVFLSILVVIVAFWTTKELFPENRLVLFAIPAFVVFLPAHTFMTSAVNNDHLAEVLVTFALSLWVVTFKRGFSRWRVVGIIVAIALALWAKRTALFAIPLCAVGVGIYLWGRAISRTFSWRKVLAILPLTAVMVTIMALSLREWSRTTADVNRIGSGLEWLLHFYLFLPSERFPFSLQQDYFGSEALAAYRYYGVTLFETFWARFGWYNIRVDTTLYGLLALASLLAFTGLCLSLVRTLRGQSQSTSWQTRALVFYTTAVLFAVGIAVAARIRYWDLGSFGAPHGRYLYPVIVPIATLFVSGLKALVPVRYSRLWLTGWLGGLAVLDLVSLMRYVIPFYYGS